MGTTTQSSDIGKYESFFDYYMGKIKDYPDIILVENACIETGINRLANNPINGYYTKVCDCNGESSEKIVRIKGIEWDLEDIPLWAKLPVYENDYGFRLSAGVYTYSGNTEIDYSVPMETDGYIYWTITSPSSGDSPPNRELILNGQKISAHLMMSYLGVNNDYIRVVYQLRMPESGGHITSLLGEMGLSWNMDDEDDDVNLNWPTDHEQIRSVWTNRFTKRGVLGAILGGHREGLAAALPPLDWVGPMKPCTTIAGAKASMLRRGNSFGPDGGHNVETCEWKELCRHQLSSEGEPISDELIDSESRRGNYSLFFKDSHIVIRPSTKEAKAAYDKRKGDILKYNAFILFNKVDEDNSNDLDISEIDNLSKYFDISIYRADQEGTKIYTDVGEGICTVEGFSDKDEKDEGETLIEGFTPWHLLGAAAVGKEIEEQEEKRRLHWLSLDNSWHRGYAEQCQVIDTSPLGVTGETCRRKVPNSKIRWDVTTKSDCQEHCNIEPNCNGYTFGDGSPENETKLIHDDKILGRIDTDSLTARGRRGPGKGIAMGKHEVEIPLYNCGSGGGECTAEHISRGYECLDCDEIPQYNIYHVCEIYGHNFQYLDGWEEQPTLDILERPLTRISDTTIDTGCCGRIGFEPDTCESIMSDRCPITTDFSMTYIDSDGDVEELDQEGWAQILATDTSTCNACAQESQTRERLDRLGCGNMEDWCLEEQRKALMPPSEKGKEDLHISPQPRTNPPPQNSLENLGNFIRSEVISAKGRNRYNPSGEPTTISFGELWNESECNSALGTGNIEYCNQREPRYCHALYDFDPEDSLDMHKKKGGCPLFECVKAAPRDSGVLKDTDIMELMDLNNSNRGDFEEFITAYKTLDCNNDKVVDYQDIRCIDDILINQ